VIKNPLITDEERAAADIASAEEALREKMAQAQEQLNQAQEKLDSLQQQLGEAYDILAEMRKLYEQTKQEADRAEEAARLAEENSLLSEEYAALAEEARDQAEALKAAVERMKNDIEVLETRILELRTEVETARDEALTAADEAKDAADEVKNAADEARGAVTEVRGIADEMKNVTDEILVAREKIDSFRVQMEENQESVNNIYNIILNIFQDFESRINNLSKVETIYYGGGSDNWVAQNQQDETKNDTQMLENSDTDETQNVNERLHEYTPTRKEDEQKIEVPKLGIADCSINIWPWIMAGAVLGIAFTSILFMIIERRQDHEETHI
jgi:chromosome segregation ATPase